MASLTRDVNQTSDVLLALILQLLRLAWSIHGSQLSVGGAIVPGYVRPTGSLVIQVKDVQYKNLEGEAIVCKKTLSSFYPKPKWQGYCLYVVGFSLIQPSQSSPTSGLGTRKWIDKYLSQWDKRNVNYSTTAVFLEVAENTTFFQPSAPKSIPPFWNWAGNLTVKVNFTGKLPDQVSCFSSVFAVVF